MSDRDRRVMRTLRLVATIAGAGMMVSAQVPAYSTPMLRCSGRTATIVGTGGDDRLVGTPRRDVIVGLGGADIIRGVAGNDVLCGGGGIDRLYGGPGADEVIDHSELSDLFGGRGDDLLRSKGEYNDLFGGRGDDRILAPVSDANGGPGDDILRGGSRLNGGAGSDRLTGTVNDYDEFMGGPGWDVIEGRGAKGIGDDFVYHHKASTGVLVDMRRGVVRGPSTGRDVLVGHDYHVIGSEHADVFIGGRRNDSFDGLGGRDELRGRGGADRLLGGEGRDGIWGGRGADEIGGADCDGGLRSGGGPLCRPVSQHHGDVMRGGPGDDIFNAENGNDLILGRRGDDRAWNYGGDDVLRGGAGSDRLFSAGGDDRYIGGRGFDVAGFEYCQGGVEASLVTLSASGCGSDTMRGIEGLYGTGSSDVLVGDHRRNMLHGSYCCSFGGDQDHLVAKGGNDVLMTSGEESEAEGESYVFDGGGGTDTASFADLWHDDVHADLMTGFGSMRSSGFLALQLISIEGLVGSPFDDVLLGNGAGNSLVGLKGSDSIEGRDGNDTLRGGTGWIGNDGRRRKSGETDRLDGGSGTDRCTGGESAANCESEPERAR